MRIARYETLHCAAGTRVWAFLKLETDDGIVGWAEFTDGGYSSRGTHQVVERLAALVVGQDPSNTNRLEAILRSATHEAEEGLNRRAAAAILNASLDIRAKALGVSVATLLGGALRTRLPVYWSHCALGRIRMSQAGVHPPVRSLDDITALGREVRERGFTALKTNVILFEDGAAKLYLPLWDPYGEPSLELAHSTIEGVADLVDAFREGTGDGIQIFLDTVWTVKGEAIPRLARRLSQTSLDWLEADTHDPEQLLAARGNGKLKIVSGEALSGVREYRRFFDRRAMDIVKVDVAWNGMPESKRIADLAASYDLNVAPHNPMSHLMTHMSAQFGATLSNFSILEADIDGVPWRDELVTPPVIEDGALVLSDAPGWGCEVNEEAIRAHPPTFEV
ncbi:mandelate racemase/muconate lactonizing enzyme family protein [Microbacterium sp.]|uniref:mandelate racemase/muconate lactonizing enzyme family protein n=1 Tax=Microbacterium sp. TaxID=51671 RepID=UPI002D1AAAD1|nr:mandelate racemase/muconate lactonizing enzyme family protein [Microbacterium sp.]HWL77888.1 mandelate racemase/muconate lactonizing enzyme family protein [Microbacterium sp.]